MTTDSRGRGGPGREPGEGGGSGREPGGGGGSGREPGRGGGPGPEPGERGFSRRWFRMLLHLYPEDFRQEMGEALVETYVERARVARSRGRHRLAALWVRALADSVRNGVGERVSPSIAWRRSGNWGRDGELVLRRLVRAPVFVLAVVGTLVVGLGTFAVVFAVVHGVLIAPLPYEEPDELYYVWRDYRAFFDLDRGWTGGTDIAALAEAGGAIDDVAGLRRVRATMMRGAGGEPSEVAVMMTTPNLFDLLGMGPSLGRGFAADEGGPGRPPVLVLTHDLWTRMGADSALLGGEVLLDGGPFTVIGVLPRDFEFVRHSSVGPPEHADAYATFDYDLAETNPGSGAFSALVRAADGTSPETLQQAVAAVGRMVDRRDFSGRGLRLYAVPIKPDLVSRARPALSVIGAAGTFLVVVLLVNLASLLLVRAMQREREFAVSRALGASRMALGRATILEGAALGLLGGVGGALAAVWATRVLVALAPADLPRRATLGVDWTVGLGVVATGTVLGLLAGTIPAAWAVRTRLSSLLGATAVRGGGGHGRMRRAMVVVQVALSLVLLSAGGLVVRSFRHLLNADAGFAPAGVLTFRVPLDVEDEAAADALQARIVAELAALPGVTSAGAAAAPPLTAETDQTPVSVPGAPGNTGDPETDAPLADVVATRSGWFETLGMRVVEGRTFQPPTAGAPQEALIDRQLARQFFPAGSAIGADIDVGGEAMRVVGVVDHARLYDIHADGRPQVYLYNRGPYGQATLYYAVRSDREPASLVREVRGAIARVDRGLAVADVRTMDEIVAESLAQQRISAVLIAGFALGALLLAAMGLFGVVSGSVTRRRHELALRLALGASPGRVLRAVVGEGVRLIALGLLMGVPGVVAAGRLIRSVLLGVSPLDPFTLATVAAGLAAVSLLACYLPARRVTAIDPARALRQD